MLSPRQSRAARGWLNWTQAQLANRASIGLSTLRDFESGGRTPIQNNVAAIQRALEEGGAGAFLAATDGLAPADPDGAKSEAIKSSGERTRNVSPMRQRSRKGRS
jgi:transcriptional regulator with XRE-family HTH domain